MNKNYTLLSIFVLTIFSLLISSEKVLATVGGPTYVSRIVYDSQNKAVYYLENDYGGKGCPPVINKIDLRTKIRTEVKSCDEVFASAGKDYQDYEVAMTEYKKFIEDTLRNFSKLHAVSLKKNNISAEVKVVSESKTEDYPEWTDFEMEVKQDGVKKANIDFRGCSPDQPNIVEGYMVPDSSTMIVLFSRVSDCFEGGYIGEDLYLVEGINYYDENSVRFEKTETATDVNVGNLVVYATSKNLENKDNVSVPQKNSGANIVLLVTTFVIGITLGYIVGRKSLRSPDKDPSNPSNL